MNGGYAQIKVDSYEEALKGIGNGSKAYARSMWTEILLHIEDGQYVIGGQTEIDVPAFYENCGVDDTAKGKEILDVFRERGLIKTTKAGRRATITCPNPTQYLRIPKARKTPAKYTPSDEAKKRLATWEASRELPSKTPESRSLYLKTIDDLHTLDKQPWAVIDQIIHMAVKVWERKFIQSPSKLRTKNKHGKYSELYCWEILLMQYRDRQHTTAPLIKKKAELPDADPDCDCKNGIRWHDQRPCSYCTLGRTILANGRAK